MGEQGACFVSPDTVLLARPPHLKVKSTVGAGDAMAAGLVAAQFEQCALPACARLATSFSVELLTRSQAVGGTATSIKVWMEQVAIEASWQDS